MPFTNLTGQTSSPWLRCKTILALSWRAQIKPATRGRVTAYLTTITSSKHDCYIIPRLVIYKNGNLHSPFSRYLHIFKFWLKNKPTSLHTFFRQGDPKCWYKASVVFALAVISSPSIINFYELNIFNTCPETTPAIFTINNQFGSWICGDIPPLPPPPLNWCNR